MSWKKLTLKGVVAGLALPVLLISTEALLHGAPPAPTARTLVIPGTGDSQDMLRAIAEQFKRKQPGIDVVIPPSIGTSGGIRALRHGEMTMARGARRPREEEQQANLRFLVFAWSPVVIAANLQQPCPSGLDYEQLVAVYNGTLRDYAALGCAPGKVYPIMREEGDSSLTILKEHVPGFSEIQSPVGPVYYTTPEALEAVAAHKNALGFFPLAAIRDSNLTILPVNGFLPTAENLRKGRYTLAVPLLILYTTPPGPAESAFIDFLHTREATKTIMRYKAIPALPDTGQGQ